MNKSLFKKPLKTICLTEILYIYCIHIKSKYIEPNVYIRTRSLAMTQWNTFKNFCLQTNRSKN